MCGIAGWINLKEDLSQQYGVVEKMSEKLAPRGPDASGLWTSPHALIGHRRLTVVDPAGGGQPMVRERSGYSYVITYNGELYNTVDIRQQLKCKGYLFKSTSDTEVLLASYMEWGPECVDYLNGIYAFGIWDEKENSFFLARDRFGVKPLFYAVREESLIFASELKAMLVHPLIKPEVDFDGLAEIFAIGPARTPGQGVFKNVSELKPAHCMIINSKGIRIKRYWSFESSPHLDSLESTISKVKELVHDSIERQLVSDVPVCTFLSGGLDSSAISALAARHFENKGKGRLHTYSIDYADNEIHFKPSSFQPNSDAPWVKRMSEELGTHHHFITVDTPQLVEALHGAVKARDLPGMADVDSSLWLFCREVKKGATVALSGECADEIFGGYPWFHREDMLNSPTFPWSRYMNLRKKILSRDLVDFIKPKQYADQRYLETLAEVPGLPGENSIDARRREVFYLNITWFMQTLLDRKDRMSMSAGLEVRVPYCDHRLAQYLWNIPWEMKALEGREKGLLRKALEGLLPNDVLYRKKSPYPKTHNPSYEKAVRKWLMEILNDSSSPLLQLIDKNEIINMLKTSTSDHGRPFFGQLMALPQLFAYLIQVDIWMREYRVRLV
ncbi:MAG: asparagine synthase (glutamine-hydrolyzing) [Clostridia bacterium]|nr:asparagine synthase (glutamine-hydrolyzing) [Clostridia bacterium]